MDLGLEAAGFATVGLIEHDDAARRSLKANREGQWPLLNDRDVADASRLGPSDFGMKPGDLSLLAGGPPCQPFSKAGQWAASSRSGMSDERSDTLHHFMRILERFLPAAVLIENVPGFVRGPVSAVDYLKHHIDRINSKHGTRYELDYRLLDAAHFGVPQKRTRAILVISRQGSEFGWPTATSAQDPVRAWDAIGNLRLDDEDVPSLRGKWADLLPSIPEGRNYLWHTPGDGGRPLFGDRTRFWTFLLKLSKEKPSWTVSAQPGPSTGPFHWESRPLAVKELLRLQSFPIDWIVEGEFREQVRQVGNATPPLLSEIVGRAITTHLGFKAPSGAPRYSIERRTSVPPPEPISEVPSRYRVMERDHPSHPGTGKGPAPRVVRH